MKPGHINLILPNELLDLLKAYAADHDLNISQVVRKALREFLERNRG